MLYKTLVASLLVGSAANSTIYATFAAILASVSATNPAPSLVPRSVLSLIDVAVQIQSALIRYRLKVGLYFRLIFSVQVFVVRSD